MAHAELKHRMEQIIDYCMEHHCSSCPLCAYCRATITGEYILINVARRALDVLEKEDE